MAKVAVVLEVADQQAVGALKNFQRATADAISQIKAGDPALRSATVRVQELTTAKGRAATVANQWTGALNLLPGALGAVTTQVTTAAQAANQLTTALGGAGGAGRAAGLIGGIGAVIAVGALFMKSLGDQIERLDNLSRQTGLAVSSLQAFEHAARQAGESPDTLIQGLSKVNAAIQDVLTGAPNAGKAFEAIGVPLREMVRAGASAEDILEATAQALTSIEDPTRRAAAQVELFGVRGRSMSTVLDTIAQKSLPGYVQELKAAGIVTDRETQEMARAFDTFFDQVQERAKGFATETATGFMKDVQMMVLMIKSNLGDLQAAAELARRSSLVTPEVAEGLQAHEIVRPGMVPRPTRELPLDTQADKAALEDARKHLTDVGEAARLLNRDFQEGAELGNRYAEALNRFELERLTKEANDAVQSFTEWTPLLQTSAAEIRENNRAVDGAVGEFQQWGDVTDGLQGVLANVRTELQGLPPSIMAVRTEADRDFIRMRELLDGVDGSVERLAQNMKTQIPSALDQFRIGFEKATDDLKKQFQSWEGLGTKTAQDLHSAFSDSFFELMKGDLDDLDDVWKGFLNAVLRHITDFLAAAAVTQLFALVRNLGNFSLPGLTGGSRSSSGGDTITGSRAGDDILAGGARVAADIITASVIGQQKSAEQRLAIEQKITGESEHRLQLEQRATSGIGSQIGGTIGAIGGGLAGTAVAPGAGTLLGATGGRVAGSILGGLIEKFARDLLGLSTTYDAELSPAATHAAASTMNAVAALDGFAETLDPAGAAASRAAAANRDLAAAQTDLAIASFDVTTAAIGASTGLDQTTRDLHGFRDALDAYAAAMGEAVGIATAAAASAAGSAADAAASAGQADAGHGFGGVGTPGGAPSGPNIGPGGTSGGNFGGAVGGGPGGGFEGGGGTGGAGAGGFGGGGGGGTSDRQFGLLEGPVPGRPGAARWMRLHGGEVVATPDQAAAILEALRNQTGDGPETVRLLRRMANAMDRARRGGRAGGAALV